MYCASSITYRPSWSGPWPAIAPVSPTPYQSYSCTPPQAADSVSRDSRPRWPQIIRTLMSTPGSRPCSRATSASFLM